MMDGKTASTYMPMTGVRITSYYLLRSEEHTSELQSRPHISYAVFCLKKKKTTKQKKKKNKIAKHKPTPSPSNIQ